MQFESFKIMYEDKLTKQAMLFKVNVNTQIQNVVCCIIDLIDIII